MKFCVECSTILQPNVKSGELQFHCRCGKIYNSEANDTLMYEEHMASGESKEKYQTFIDNSSYDITGMKVDIKCPDCGIPYLTLIYIGNDEMPIYTCTCGKKYSKSELNIESSSESPKLINKSSSIEPTVPNAKLSSE